MKVVFEKIWKNFLLTGMLAIIPILGNLIYSKRVLILPFLQRIAFILLIYQLETRYRSFYQFNLQLDFLRAYITPITLFLVCFYFINYIYKLNHEEVMKRRITATGIAVLASLSFTIFKGITNAKSNGINLGLYSAYPYFSKSVEPIENLTEKLVEIAEKSQKESEELRDKLVDKGLDPMDTYPAPGAH